MIRESLFPRNFKICHSRKFIPAKVYSAKVYFAKVYYLEKDFCNDLLMDTSDALRWLDSHNEHLTPAVKRSLKCFTFDFKALYDSLKPSLTKEALAYAMRNSRPNWSDDKIAWIISLIDF